jgi:uncharacterized protein (TIGR02391 family)
MKLVDLIPDPEILCALEPDELGLRMLPALADWPEQNRNCNFTLSAFVVTVIGDGRGYKGQYPTGRSHSVEEAVREGWAWLEGSGMLIPHRGYHEPHTVRSLSRRARLLAEEPDARKVFAARRIPKEVLHPAIREDVWALYHRGKYDQAVLVAMKAVEVAVRDAAGFLDSDYGTDMIARAFNENNGPLRDPNAQPAERIALRNLFIGTHGSYKNPHSHRHVALDDPDEAAEIIMLANHLLRIVASRKAARP